MDSLTQVVLGAAVGYAVGGKALGKKSLLLGATAGLIPDLDVIPLLPFDNEFFFLKHHRGFSHSLIFTVLGSLGFTWMFQQLFGTAVTEVQDTEKQVSNTQFDKLIVREKTQVRSVFRLCKTPLFKIFFYGFLTHILLDCFTTWGTQIFWPHPHRVAWNSVFIIDPMYTVPLIIAILGAWVSRSKNKQSSWIKLGLGLSSLYLILGLGVKAYMHTQFTTLFEKNNIEVLRYTSRPSPFNIILWSSTAETQNGYYYGMVSLLDKGYENKLYYTPKNHHLFPKNKQDKNTQELLSYTKGYYSVATQNDAILIHDLRYGFMGDPWQNGPNYVFSYLITKDSNEKTTLKTINPRPKNTDELLQQLWVRIKGLDH